MALHAAARLGVLLLVVRSCMGQNVFLNTGRHAFRSLDQENKCLQHTRAAFTAFVADYSCPLNTLLTSLLTGVNPLAWEFRAREPVVAGGSAPSYEFWGRVGSKLAVCSQPDTCDACPAEAEVGGVTSPFVNCTTGAAYLYDYDEDPNPNSGPEPLTCWYLNVTGSTNLGTVVQLQPCDARFVGQCLTLSGELDNVQVYNIEKKVYEVQNQRAILRPCSEIQGWQLMDIDFNTGHVLEPFFVANMTPPAAVTVASAPPITMTPAPIAPTPTPTSLHNVTSVGSPGFSANATFLEVQQTNFALLGQIVAGNITGADQYLADDFQLFVANTTGPLTLVSNGTIIASTFGSLASAGNLTFSERIFHIQDPYNIHYVDKLNLGQPGANLLSTSVWQKQGPKWVMKLSSLTPSDNNTVYTRTTPTIFVTPNQTLNSSFPGPYNGTLPTNFTTQPEVGSTAGRLFTAFGNQSLPLVNITDQFFGPSFQLVVPGLDGPIPLNFSNPGFVGFMMAIRSRNATSPPPTAISYLQLSPTSAVLTSLVREVPIFGNVYVLLLWEYFSNATRNATANTTSGASWLLSLASVNIAPPI